MKKLITTVALVMCLAVIAFGYVSTPVTTFPPSEPNAPQVMGTKTLYVGNDVVFSIDVEDSNDDTVTVTAAGGTVTKRTSVYVGDTSVTDANGTYIFHIYKTIYDLKFRPVVEGYSYPEIVVTDSHFDANKPETYKYTRDIKYVEIFAQKKNITPVITGCRVN